MNKEVILFDLDGTLVDSEQYYLSGTLKWMQREGYHGELKDLIPLIGKTMEATHIFIQEKLPHLSVEQVAKYNNDYFVKEDPIDYQKIIFDDVYDFFDKVKGKYKLALCSMDSMEELNNFLRQTGLVFDVVVSGSECKENKPSPEVWLKAMQELNVSADKCLAVEDSYVGIKSSKNAKIYTCARRDKRFNIKQDEADYCFDSLSELISILESKNE